MARARFLLRYFKWAHVAIAYNFGLCCDPGVTVSVVSWPSVAFDWNTKVRRKRPIRTHRYSVRLGSTLYLCPSVARPYSTVEAHRTASVKYALGDFPTASSISSSCVSPLQFGLSALKIFSCAPKWKLYRSGHKLDQQSARRSVVLCGMLLAATSATGLFSCLARAQRADPATPVVVQPGAPGKPSRTLPPSTKGTLPPRSQADVEFMQGMIMHHSQAVQMTALIASHTENKGLRSLGARISSSQSDEIKFMQRWLAARGEPASVATPGMSNMDMSQEKMALMPGMLTPEQMQALRKAKGAEFDDLFLTGMIQHHNGALTMVNGLFDAPGAGQDADLFNFATDVDNTQRAEIRIMQAVLEKETLEEKR
jgi:uncharacterized protein (DUF305 family)